MLMFDPMYFVFVAPAFILMLVAQGLVKSRYSRAMQVAAPLSGAAAARHILDEAGCYDVGIEETGGHLSDHYDPSARVLRLSSDVYHTRSAAAVGIAAHEAGHALQHAQNYALLVVRNAAVPAATWGSGLSFLLLMAGALLSVFVSTGLGGPVILLGLTAFGCVLFFQVVNLPVEFNASTRAKRVLSELNIVDAEGAAAVSGVLNAAAWTYVAATLQTLMTMLYYLYRFGALMGGDD